MISIVVNAASLALTFCLPLLLTFKALMADVSSAARLQQNNAQLQFLAHYWLAYVLMVYVESVFNPHLFLSLMGQSGVLTLVFASVRVWLLYYHGCLVVNEAMGGALGSLLCGGAAPQRLRRHQPASVWLERVEARYDRHMRLALAATVQITTLGRAARLPALDGLTRLHDFVVANPQTTFLHATLQYTCFVDSTAAVHSRLNDIQQFVRLATGAAQLLPPMIKQRKTPGSRVSSHVDELAPLDAVSFSPTPSPSPPTLYPAPRSRTHTPPPLLQPPYSIPVSQRCVSEQLQLSKPSLGRLQQPRPRSVSEEMRSEYYMDPKVAAQVSHPDELPKLGRKTPPFLPYPVESRAPSMGQVPLRKK